MIPSWVRLVDDQQDIGGQEKWELRNSFADLSLQRPLKLAVSLDQGPQSYRTVVFRLLVSPSGKMHTLSGSSKPRGVESHQLPSPRIVDYLS